MIHNFAQSRQAETRFNAHTCRTQVSRVMFQRLASVISGDSITWCVCIRRDHATNAALQPSR
jgi:hypothetical protein